MAGGNRANNAVQTAARSDQSLRGRYQLDPEAYLRASNTDANDFFGVAVSITGYPGRREHMAKSSNGGAPACDQTNNATR